MAVVVSRDLTVQVLEDVNAAKLVDRQQALRAAIQRGEPKSLGVSVATVLQQEAVMSGEGMNAKPFQRKSPVFLRIH